MALAHALDTKGSGGTSETKAERAEGIGNIDRSKGHAGPVQRVTFRAFTKRSLRGGPVSLFGRIGVVSTNTVETAYSGPVKNIGLEGKTRIAPTSIEVCLAIFSSLSVSFSCGVKTYGCVAMSRT